MDKSINGIAKIMDGGDTPGVPPVFSTPMNRVPVLSFSEVSEGWSVGPRYLVYFPTGTLEKYQSETFIPPVHRIFSLYTDGNGRRHVFSFDPAAP